MGHDASTACSTAGASILYTCVTLVPSALYPENETNEDTKVMRSIPAIWLVPPVSRRRMSTTFEYELSQANSPYCVLAWERVSMQFEYTRSGYMWKSYVVSLSQLLTVHAQSYPDCPCARFLVTACTCMYLVLDSMSVQWVLIVAWGGQYRMQVHVEDISAANST